jgi:tetratricopeptide (TPR) repeat protein
LGLLAGLALAAYANSFRAGFVRDSQALILEDPRLRVANSANLGLILHQTYWWPTAESGLYRPVTTLSYLFNYAILENGANPAGYHWINLLLHVINACLAYLLASLLLRRFWPAFFTAALWAIHPVCTESVTNIVGRADELAGLSVLGALLLYIRSTGAPGWRKAPWLMAMMLAVFLGVLAKENAAIIPGLALLYDFTFRNRPNLRRLVAYAAFAPPLLVAWRLRASALAHAPAAQFPFVDNPLLGADFLTARLTAIKVIGKYLWLLLWPLRLSCDYSYNQIPLFNWRLNRWEGWKPLVALAVILGICCAAAACRRRRKAIFFFVGFSALALLPVANLVAPIGSIMAERFLYLPAVGFAGCSVAAVYAGCRRLGFGANAAPALLCVIAGALGIRTFLRNADWKDGETLWTAAVAVSPNSYKTHLSLAASVAQDNQFGWRVNEEIGEAEKAMAIVSGLPASLSPTQVFVDLGRHYARKADFLAPQGPTPEGQAWRRKALEVLLRGVAVDREIGAMYRRQELARGKPPDRVGVFGFAPLYANLGWVYLRLENPQQALEAFLYQRRLAPREPEVYRGLAGAYLDLGRTEDAIISLLEARITGDSNQVVAYALDLYDRMDPGGCAAVARQSQRDLNPDCPMVGRHLCAAMLDLMKASLEARHYDLAKQTKETARRAYGCPMESFDRVLR